MPSISHVITGLGVGGAERALHALLCGGLQQHYNSDVVSLRDIGHYGPLLQKAGIEVSALGLRPSLPSPLKLQNLKRQLQTSPKSIVQGWMYHGNLAATWATRTLKPKPKLVWNIRTSLDAASSSDMKRKLLVKASAFYSRRTDAIIYNSAQSCQQHEAAGFHNGQGIIIPNGFDTSQWRPDAADRLAVRASWNVKPTDKVICFVGRNSTEKDLPNFLKALSTVMNENADVHVVIIGRDTATAVAAHPKLPRDRLLVLGERHDVAQLLRGCDVFCLSSKREAFPNVVGEAMATGLPCVATDVGDVRDIVGDTGWVVPSQSSMALAQALSLAVATPTPDLQNRGVAARQRIITHYGLATMVSRYRTVYDNLLREP
jgi:glycosyltransferase involved in cell wall biosynthesis